MSSVSSADTPEPSHNESPEAATMRQMSEELAGLREKLRFTERFLDTVFERAPNPMVVIEVRPDGQYRVVRANRAGRAMVGDSAELDSPDAPVKATFTPDTASSFSQRLLATVKAGKTQPFHEELRMHERTVWTQALFTPFPADDPANAWVSIASFDVTEQKLRELEALAIRESIIEQQALSLNELSTPLLAISDHVVVMPLIGAIDSHRAQLIIESLLEGISQTSAEIAIIDITGVSIVDTQVANAIIRAAHAAQLLGARVVLTGIRPEIAQVMITLGVDLGNIVTLSTLHSGIAYSLRK
jgi:rsbT co-antagonist protein RsbR